MSPEWSGAFDAVDRAAFLPGRVWPFDPDTGRFTVADRVTDPEDWYRRADSNVPLTTQWDDEAARVDDAPGTVSTSSSSMPSVVFSMLGDLAVRPGMSVLEVGTGTGWSSALLAYRLGDEAVTTIEVDPLLTEQARHRLDAVGLHPTVVTGDGLLGYPPRALYDRVVVTCGLRRIPYAWVEQTRPRGLILTPWGTDYSPQDASVRLTVAEDGGSASGPFLRPVQFMKARSQRLAWPRHDAYVTDWPGDIASTTTLTADDLAGVAFGGVDFVLGLLVPDCAHTVDTEDGRGVAWFYGLGDRSWAVVRWAGGASAEVYQSGPRRLWDEVEAAWHWWDGQGRPDVDRFGMTVDADGQRVWLDSPENPLPPHVQ
ncbi:protein-L-isoaspartate O-methyltransferase [Nocardiopsis sp. Huas11]|uniref:protein-L-isoaspartate O-methyltransferase family protein n=1 Tax=Nocardiopsis sp. Huas11 TaxID=2183912 RepID=UPI000EB5980C|nr:methyltransferase domain-containing protein [Nocardiopsis sp. Huas11]